MHPLFLKTVQLLSNGGWTILPLVLVAGAMGALLFERATLLRGLSNRRFSRSPLVREAQSIYARFMKEGLSHSWLEGELSVLRSLAGRHQRLVTTLVTVSPLLGLMGTVSGMITTFDALTELSASSQGTGVASGISEALITTQIGLSLAIPGLLIQKWLKKRESRFVTYLESLQKTRGTLHAI